MWVSLGPINEARLPIRLIAIDRQDVASLTEIKEAFGISSVDQRITRRRSRNAPQDLSQCLQFGKVGSALFIA